MEAAAVFCLGHRVLNDPLCGHAHGHTIDMRVSVQCLPRRNVPALSVLDVLQVVSDELAEQGWDGAFVLGPDDPLQDALVADGGRVIVLDTPPSIWALSEVLFDALAERFAAQSVVLEELRLNEGRCVTTYTKDDARHAQFAREWFTAPTEPPQE